MLADDPLRPEIDPYAPPVAELGRPATDVDRADVAEGESIRRHHLAHETSVKGLGSLNYLGAAACVLIGIAMVVVGFSPQAGNQQMGRGAAVGLAAVLLLLAILYGFMGYGLRRLRPWGRWLTVPVIGLVFLANFVLLLLGLAAGLSGLVGSAAGLSGLVGSSIISSIIPGYFLFLLLSKKGQVVFSPAYKSIIARTPHVKMKTSIIVKILLGVLLFILAVFIIGGIISALSR